MKIYVIQPCHAVNNFAVRLHKTFVNNGYSQIWFLIKIFEVNHTRNLVRIWYFSEESTIFEVLQVRTIFFAAVENASSLIENLRRETETRPLFATDYLLTYKVFFSFLLLSLSLIAWPVCPEFGTPRIQMKWKMSHMETWTVRRVIIRAEIKLLWILWSPEIHCLRVIEYWSIIDWL